MMTKQNVKSLVTLYPPLRNSTFFCPGRGSIAPDMHIYLFEGSITPKDSFKRIISCEGALSKGFLVFYIRMFICLPEEVSAHSLPIHLSRKATCTLNISSAASPWQLLF